MDSVDAKKDTSAGDKDDSATDNVDARFAGLRLGAGDDKYRYRMDHRRRGRFIIINNKTFQPQTQMNERKGTDVDASNLYADFRQLGFDVELCHNQKANDMLQLMIRASEQDHSDCDCFAVAVLSHGDDGVLYGTDAVIAIDNFIAPIKKCRTLVGKPKIFIFQACRGNELDDGIDSNTTDATAEQSTQRIPIEADCLYVYSTVPGYFSWRNSSNGSWFVQALHRMLAEFRDKPLDFVSLLTRVNHEVAYAFESNAAQAHMTRKKQVPSINSMLTKDLYFTPK